MKNILITGAGGMLADELVRYLDNTAFNITALNKSQLDITQESSIQAAFQTYTPDILINAAAYNNVDAPESDEKAKQAAYQVNANAPELLAKHCKQTDCLLIHYSTDYIFDGEKEDGYDESSIPSPLCEYGKSKYAGEKHIETQTNKYYIVRISRLFGPAGSDAGAKQSFVDILLSRFEEHGQQEYEVVQNEISSPSYSKDVVAFTQSLINEKVAYGIYHGANSGACSWHDFAQEIFHMKNYHVTLHKVDSESFKRLTKRPKSSILLNTKRPQQRPWQEALKDYIATNA